jgi:DNA-binding response OmpR family regulator
MRVKKILIVEDDADLAKALCKRMKANSYETLYALDAMAGIQMAHKEKPDLIILDIGLPGGDGFVVKKRLDSSVHLSNIPVIVITAMDPSSTFKRSLKAGVAAFFQKPVDDEQLLRIVKIVLGESEDEHEDTDSRG